MPKESKLPKESAGYSETPVPKTKRIAVIILDVSGSMGDPVSEQTTQKKIEDAREVITKTVKHPDADLYNFGFAAFGHLPKGCDKKNIDFLQEPLPEKNSSEILPLLSNLEPIGQTPLALAIKEIGERLLNTYKIEKQKMTIVLVSDGEENCGGLPVEEVKNLKRKGLNFVFDVIGYGTDEKINENLKKLAEEGEGQLYEPKNIDEFQEDMKKSVFGDGTIKVIELENKNVKGWKLYKGHEQIFDFSRSSTSADELWKERDVAPGKYNFCLYFQEQENVLVKRIDINPNAIAEIGPADLISIP